MRPSHRLDVFAVPHDPAFAPVEELRAFYRDLVSEAVIDARGRPSANAARWMPEGFAGLRVDLPLQMALYANRQGGFRVYCPVANEPITLDFSRAFTEARRGPRPDLATFPCPACGGTHTLAETQGRPAFRFASLSLQTIDAEALRPDARLQGRLREVLGPLEWVAVRT